VQPACGKDGVGLPPGDAASFKLISGTLGHLAGEMLVGTRRPGTGARGVAPRWLGCTPCGLKAGAACILAVAPTFALLGLLRRCRQPDRESSAAAARAVEPVRQTGLSV